MESANTRVLVTGASGFVAGHVIDILLSKGYLVRGTVRSLKDEKKTKPIYDINPAHKDKLELVEANLLDPAPWATVCKDCTYVMHVASPFPSVAPKDENELVKPAVDGTLNVLKGALENNVKKVVLTSSVAAIMQDENIDSTVFTEEMWADPNKVAAYPKSKTLAERAAWDFIKQNEGRMELTCINPAFIIGPAVSGNSFTSGDLIAKVLNGEMPAIPDMSLGMVDVRDVALAHYNAMINPATSGKRYILSEKSVTLKEMVDALREEFEKEGFKLPKRVVGFWPLKFLSFFKKELRSILKTVGKKIKFDNSKSIQELGINYRPYSQAIKEMGHSLINLGVVKPPKSKK